MTSFQFGNHDFVVLIKTTNKRKAKIYNSAATSKLNFQSNKISKIKWSGQKSKLSSIVILMIIITTNEASIFMQK